MRPQLLHVALRTLGGFEVRDIGLLQSAAARPRSTAFGEDAYPSIHDEAAALLHSVARTHPLVDGIERLSLAATIAFYGLDGIQLTLSNDEAHDLVMAVAVGELDDVEPIAERLRANTAPGADGASHGEQAMDDLDRDRTLADRGGRSLRRPCAARGGPTVRTRGMRGQLRCTRCRRSMPCVSTATTSAEATTGSTAKATGSYTATRYCRSAGSSVSTTAYPPSPTRATKWWMVRLVGFSTVEKASRTRFRAASNSASESVGRSRQVTTYLMPISLRTQEAARRRSGEDDARCPTAVLQTSRHAALIRPG
jgi:death-on-curing protein